MCRLIVLLNIDGLFLNSIQLRLSSSRRNAIWIRSLASRDRLSIMVGWYWRIAEPRWFCSESLLCATSEFSVSLWLFFPINSEPQRHRELRGGTEKAHLERSCYVYRSTSKALCRQSRALAGAGSLYCFVTKTSEKVTL